MNKKTIPSPVPRPRAKAAAAASPVGKAAAPKRELKHPMLDEARKLAQEGKPKEAADLLEKLAAQLKGNERAQIFIVASQFVRKADIKRSVALAEQATQAAPSLTRAWSTLSFAHDERRDRKASIAAGLKALETPANPRERVDLGRHLARLGEDRKALEAVKQAYKESGENIELATLTLRVALQCADWELANRITAVLKKAHDEGRTKEVGETPRTHVLWCADEAINVKVVSAFAEKMFPPQEPMTRAAWPDSPNRKLRIGYLSSDYRDHATTLLALGMMRHHDHERFQFFAYCTSYDDGSAIRRDMLSRFDVARIFSNASDKRAAQQIVTDKIDVLIDLNGLTEGTRHGILAWRPAPVQIAYLGYPGTTGGRFVDYIIADDYTIPPGHEALYPEHVIRIPPTYQINDYRARWLPPLPRRASTGLPQGVPIIGMFNNVNKVGSQVWDTWMKIMHAVPTAVLWMLDSGEMSRENLTKATQAAGVDPKRLIFAPKMRQEAHIARLQYCDLVLDPWPYGGHTTTTDALFAGVPVVALEGTNFASRVSGGLLIAAGLKALVRTTIEAYIKTAVNLLQRPEDIQKIKRFIRQRKPTMPVFDAQTRTRQLEAAYMDVHARRAAGKPAQHLDVRLKRPPTTPAEGAPAKAP